MCHNRVDFTRTNNTGASESMWSGLSLRLYVPGVDVAAFLFIEKRPNM